MAIEQNKVTAVQRRQVAVTQHKTDLSTIKSQARRGQDRRHRPVLRHAVEAGPDRRRSSDPTKVDVDVLARRRHRRPHDPGQQAGLLGPARLLVHAGRRPRASSRSSTATTDAAGNSVDDHRQGQRDRDRRRDAINANEGRPSTPPSSRRAPTSGSSSPRARPARTRTSPSTPPRWPAARWPRCPPTRARARRSTPTSSLDGVAPTAQLESNVIENAIPGVRLTLKGVTHQPGLGHHDRSPPSTPTRSPRRSRRWSTPTTPSSPRTRSELTEKRVPTATTSADLQKGQLFGDSGMTVDAAQLKSHDDPDAERPRAQRPGRHRHRRAQVHRRLTSRTPRRAS